MNNPRLPTRGFTLVELLVVISIIIVLIGVAFPVFQGVQKAAKKTQAKNDLLQIVTAVNAFYTEYGRYPTTATTDADAAVGPGSAGSKTNDLVLTELRGLAATTLNPRMIVFISSAEVKDQTQPRNGVKTNGEFYDPWGSPYGIGMDANYDNQIANPYDPDKGAGGANIRQGVIAWSLGPNGALGGGTAASSKFTKEAGAAKAYTSSDDVISWQ